MFPMIFLLINLHYQGHGANADQAFAAFRTHALCMKARQKIIDEVNTPVFGSSAKSHAFGTECIRYKIAHIEPEPGPDSEPPATDAEIAEINRIPPPPPCQEVGQSAYLCPGSRFGPYKRRVLSEDVREKYGYEPDKYSEGLSEEARKTMFKNIFLRVNMHHKVKTPNGVMEAYRTRKLCEAAIKQAKEEVADPEFGSSAKSHAAGLECIPYRVIKRR